MTTTLLDPTRIKSRRMFSQGGQDGIIQSIFQQIGTTNRFCVEFGFNHRNLTGGSGANTARLILQDRWTGLLLDGERSNPAINLHAVFLTPENIGQVFRRHRVPQAPDYVSIDVDSDDLWLFQGMLKAQFRPRLVSVEYNCNFKWNRSVTVRPGTRWSNDDGVYGASLAALFFVARKNGYHLVAVEPQLDAFFVREELCNPARVPGLEKFERVTGIPTHRAPTPERQRMLVNFPSLTPATVTPWKK